MGGADPAVRATPRLREMAILVRPHPQRLEEWTADALAALARAGNVVWWGSNPVDADSRADYFDSMSHAAAVVGLNTSALVEAAIVDRPVFTILLPEFRDSQEGTFHFHYLLDVGERVSQRLALARRARGAARRSVVGRSGADRIVASSNTSSGRAARRWRRRRCSPTPSRRLRASRLRGRSGRRHGCSCCVPLIYALVLIGPLAACSSASTGTRRSW